MIMRARRRRCEAGFNAPRGFSPPLRSFVPGQMETGLESRRSRGPGGREERGRPGPSPPPASAGPYRAGALRGGSWRGAPRPPAAGGCSPS